MDMTQVALFILGVVCAVLGWFGRQLWDAVQNLRADMGALKVQIATEYITYDRLKDRLDSSLQPIKDGLDEIKKTLLHKADKP